MVFHALTIARSMLIHGFSLVNSQLLMAFRTAFYAITVLTCTTINSDFLSKKEY